LAYLKLPIIRIEKMLAKSKFDVGLEAVLRETS
jgi:hypothetical protein